MKVLYSINFEQERRVSAICGLAGILGQGIHNFDLDVLRGLAYVNGLRGLDSTGVLQVSRNGTVITKNPYNISYFMQYHKYHPDGNRNVFQGLQNYAFAVHTRAASKGAINMENAHPFEFKNVIGMHNGTIFSKYHHEKKTDSELLIEDINNRGISDVLLDLDSKDAYALVLYDKNRRELIFTRNEHRSLYYCVSERRYVVYWASEAWMLKVIMQREREPILNNKIWEFSPGFLYKIDPFAVKKGDKPFKKVPLQEERPRPKLTVIESNIKPLENEKEEVKNLPILKPPLKVVENKEKIPVHYCCGCQRKLSLVEQYFSERYNHSTFVCQDCLSHPNTVGSSK